MITSQPRARLVDRRLAGEDRDEVAEHRGRGLRRRRRPGPDIVISVIAGASTMTALNGPSIGASGWSALRKQGKTRTLIPSPRRSATPSSFSDRPSSFA